MSRHESTHLHPRVNSSSSNSPSPNFSIMAPDSTENNNCNESNFNGVLPQNPVTQNCCTNCKASGRISIVTHQSEHPAFNNVSFCNYKCFNEFLTRVAGSSQLKTQKCTLCKKDIISAISDGVLGTFCSLECLQTMKLRERKSPSTISTANHNNSLPSTKMNVSMSEATSNSSNQIIVTAAQMRSSNTMNRKSPSQGTPPPPLVSLERKTENSLASSDSSDSDSVHSDSVHHTHDSSADTVDEQYASPKAPTKTKLIAKSPNLDAQKIVTSPSSSLASPTSTSSVTMSNKIKQSPAYTYETFAVYDWRDDYSEDEMKKWTAPQKCFKQHVNLPKNEFQIGMKLEAQDPRNLSSNCVATVVGLLGPRVLLRLDGCDNTNDFWELIDSENIHPIGYCKKTGFLLQPPIGFKKNDSQWHSFITNILKSANSAPESAFIKPPASPGRNYFKVGMKLEAVDRKNPRLIRPATIDKIDRNKVTISYDGWKETFDADYDSRDLFPVGWCKNAEHPLQPPKGRAPTRHNEAKKMSMTSYTGMKVAIQNSRIVHDKINNVADSLVVTSTASPELNMNKSTVNRMKNTASTRPVSTIVETPRPPPKDTREATKATLIHLNHQPDEPCIINLKPNSNTKRLPSSTSKANSSSIAIKKRKNNSNGVNNSMSNGAKLITINQVAPSTENTNQRSHPIRENINGKNNLVNSERHSEPERDNLSMMISTAPVVENVQSSPSSPQDSPPATPCRPPGDPQDWTVDDVIDFLLASDQSLAPHVEMFRTHEIDGKALLLLSSDAMMTYMKLRLGPALKIVSLVEKLKPK